MTDDFNVDRSVQTRPEASQPATNLLTGWLQVMSDSDEAPRYWSRTRDVWLRKFLTSPGNDLLAGTVSTVIAKVAGTGWYLEGPERTANLYRKILLQQSDFGAGWDVLLAKSVSDYLTQDAGGWMERIRLGESGAALGVAALDNAQVYITGDAEYPAMYTTAFSGDAEPDKRDFQKLHRSQVIHLVDQPSPRERMLGVGFCAMSRALTTARILMDIAKYERERLSDLPPAGLLLLNNMSQQQWGDLQQSYDVREQQRGNTVWRQVMVAFGLDPSVPLSADLVTFSNLPEAFDKQTFTEIAVYSFALAFRIDPREIWPVSAGTLGTATETEVMHLKARAKGAGLILTQIERAFNDGLTLPPSLAFRFDYQDSEEDAAAAAIAMEKAAFIRKLWEPSMVGEGIVSREEARGWLVREGLFDEEDLLVMDDSGRAEDVEQAKAHHIDLGPKVRAYRDGRTVRLEKRAKQYAIPKAVNIIPSGAEEPLPPVPERVEISEADIEDAIAYWNKLMPEYRGMLDAEVEGREDYGELPY